MSQVRWPFTRYGTRELVASAAVFGGLTALAAWLWGGLAAVVPAALLALAVAFFRDPERTPPDGDDLVVSPADGRVADIEEVREAEFLDADAVRVGIFMSVFNVHVNRAPTDGTVAFRDYRPGRFRNAMGAAAARENECSLIGIERPDGTRVLVKQIAGLIARRIVTACAVDDTVRRGERIGMVKFGSRLEVYVPVTEGLKLTVVVGDKVRAGASPLGRLPGDGGAVS
ncbi:MAG: phosphatidylserine decarboxylase family protein [Planctomycetota bacterium]